MDFYKFLKSKHYLDLIKEKRKEPSLNIILIFMIEYLKVDLLSIWVLKMQLLKYLWIVFYGILIETMELTTIEGF